MQKLQEERDEMIRKREEEGDPMTQEELDRPLLRPDEEEEMHKTTKMERRKVWEWVKVNA
jgi:hypothetical protein